MDAVGRYVCICTSEWCGLSEEYEYAEVTLYAGVAPSASLHDSLIGEMIVSATEKQYVVKKSSCALPGKHGNICDTSNDDCSTSPCLVPLATNYDTPLVAV